MAECSFASAVTAASLTVRTRSNLSNPTLFRRSGFCSPKYRPLVVLLPRRALESSVRSGTGAKGEMEKEKESKLWGGRFEEGVHESVERFTESVSFEAQELWMHDIRGSTAHANMLAAQVLY